MDLSDFSVLVVDKLITVLGTMRWPRFVTNISRKIWIRTSLGLRLAPATGLRLSGKYVVGQGLRIHIRNSGEEMLSGYLSELEVREITVIVPEDDSPVGTFQNLATRIVDREEAWKICDAR